MSDRSVNGEFKIQGSKGSNLGAFKNSAPLQVNVKPMVAWLLDHHHVVHYAETLTKTKAFLLSYLKCGARSNGSFGITLMGGSYLLEHSDLLWLIFEAKMSQNGYHMVGEKERKRESQPAIWELLQSRSTIRKGGVPPYFDLSSLSMQTWKPECELPLLRLRLFSYMLYLCTKINCNRIYIHNGWKLVKKSHFYNIASEASYVY